MTKLEIVCKINRDHLEKISQFNAASEEDKLKLAFDSKFWGHNCYRYNYYGRCLDCGAILKLRPSDVVRVPLPRRAGVLP